MATTATKTVPMTYEEFLKTPETNRIQELHFGFIVRDFPDNQWHQVEQVWLSQLIFSHVRERRLGHMTTAPVGVVLDRENALVLSPDILVLREDRLNLLKEGKVCGGPNLVVEIASPSTRRRDRQKKVQWYRSYGVQECWLVDARAHEIEVFDLEAQPVETSQVFRGDEPFHSRVLPDFLHPTSDLFDRYMEEVYQRLDTQRSSYDKDRT